MRCRPCSNSSTTSGSEGTPPCSSWNTRWTWYGRSPTASSYCTTAPLWPTAILPRSSPRPWCRKPISAWRSPVTDPLLQLSGVHTHIGPYHILHGVDFAVPAGELTMLLGRNGAGKTTTLRTIMGLWQAPSGNIRFDGSDITTRSTPDIARAGIAYVPEAM